MTTSFTLHDLPKEERPRERLVKFGEQALSVQELLQLILGRGIAGESVTVTAQKLLTTFGSLSKLGEASLDELSQIKGIGLAKATQIKAVFEINKRLQNQTVVYHKKELINPENVFKFVRGEIKDYKKEHFLLICLNVRCYSISTISIGTLTSNLVHPREVFSQAIKNNAASVIFVHNHPSGNTEPSDEDITITKRLVEAGKLLGITVNDHLIISQTGYFSFKDHDLI